MNNNLIFGKLPPQAPDLEGAILGAIMLEPDKCIEVLEIIPDGECFYVEAHRIIYDAIRTLESANSRIDALTVAEHLSNTGLLESVGGRYYFTQLTMNVVSSAHAEVHARIIMEKWMKREQIIICGAAISAAYNDDDAFEITDCIEKGLQRINDRTGIGESINIPDTIVDVLNDMALAKQLQGCITGVDTGISILNAATNGWQPTDHIVIAGRPGQGKTAFALNMMLNAAFAGTPVYYHSLEMGRKALVRRCLAIIAGVELKRIRHGQTTESDEQAMRNASDIFSRLPITIDDRSGVTMQQIFYKGRRLKRKKKIGLIIIDYLQLCRPSDKKANREQQVAEMSWTAKTMAKELNVPVIDLCQMNRAIEQVKRRPVASDLRESGSLEQDADVIAFLHHEQDANTGRNANLFVIVKFRDGEVGTHELRFTSAIQKWTDADDHRFDGFVSFTPQKEAPPRAQFEEEPF